jgi:hypothetical protein
MTTIRELDQRLERGWTLIDEARESGDYTKEQTMTDHWMSLEAQYRALWDEEGAITTPTSFTAFSTRTDERGASQQRMAFSMGGTR